MKLYCVLFSFAFANILAETIDNYKMEVVITNELIRQANEANGLPNVIRRIFEENRQYSLEDLVYLWTVPDQAAIKAEKLSSSSQIPDLNLKPPQIGSLVTLSIFPVVCQTAENIEKCIEYEHTLQNAIIESIACIESKPAAESLENEISKADLQIDSHRRRLMVKKHLKCLMDATDTRHKPSLIVKCYLTGLFRTSLLEINESDNFIKSANIDPEDNCCTLTSAKNDFSFYPMKMTDVQQYLPDSNDMIRFEMIEP
ncbi:uncharacterized protein LOC126844466 isoform X3 [Adelges cooleyi]|uniref:uncharacterized protein LOC126844466 isoform X2 n=1 Tax=Adelges cooleyi TaxID=133065 RepID=UPI00217F7A3B|nr:uncharacterized protein LOC126844466 isoform X2 [Adelges cooleyi]XP_050438641.1 uncharacterized protein LOC126844466 isoform X3 [Adelges cooleyi]